MTTLLHTCDVLKLIDGSADPSPRFFGQAVEILRRHNLTKARMCIRLLQLDEPAGPNLRVMNETFHAPRILPKEGRLTSLVFGVCTLGSEITDFVGKLQAERKMSLALALDRLGNGMLMEGMRQLQDMALAMVRRQGLSMAGELRAGDPGLDLSCQPAIVRLAEGQRIGMTVSSGLALHPAKSATVMYGAGKGLVATGWSRCDECRFKAKCNHLSQGVNQSPRKKTTRNAA